MSDPTIPPKRRGRTPVAVGSVTQTFLCSLRASARSRGLSFHLSLQDLWGALVAQDHRCAISGLVLTLDPRATPHLTNASVDRVDSALGYEPGNIQWVHKDINMMKGCLTTQDFIQLCGFVSNRFAGNSPPQDLLPAAKWRSTTSRPKPPTRLPSAERRTLTVDGVLQLFDAFHGEHGVYPTCLDPRPVPGLTDRWGNIDMALRLGLRGLSGGSSISRLLALHRGVPRRWRTAGKH